MPETTTTTSSATRGEPDLAAATAAGTGTGEGGTGYRGPTVLVEAATAEAAIAEVHERFGPAARIVDARRELRGGIRGFFAQQVVELHVAVPGEGAPADLPPVGPPLDTTPPDGLGDPPGRGPAFASPRRPAPRPERPVLGRTEPDADELAAAVRAAIRDGHAAVADGLGGVRPAVVDRPTVASTRRATEPAAAAPAPGSPVDRLLGGLAGADLDGPAVADPVPAEPVPAASPPRSRPAVADPAPVASTNGASPDVDDATEPAPDLRGGAVDLRSREAEDRAFAAYLRQQLGADRLPDDLPMTDDGTPVAAEADPRPAPATGRVRPPTSGDDDGGGSLLDGAPADVPTGAWALVGAAVGAVGASVGSNGHRTAQPVDAPASEPAGLRTLVIPEAEPTLAPDADSVAALGTAPVAAPAAAPATSAPEPATIPLTEPEPATDGGPAWSATALIRLGLPAEWVRSLPVASPSDDLAWLSAVTEAVRGVCRPLPGGAAVLVGEHAPAVAEVTGEPVARSRTFQTALRRGRWVHLVAGGTRWRELLGEDPLAVSWTEPEALPDALRCALELGLVLGYGPLGGSLRRARPVDVALALRALVEE